MNRRDLARNLGRIASELLKEKGYISFVDVFTKLECLDGEDIENWRRRRVPYLERVIRISLGKINFIMKTVRQNSINAGLKPSRTAYMSWGKGKKAPLRFSKTGNPAIEDTYATHFLSKRMKNSRQAVPGGCERSCVPSSIEGRIRLARRRKRREI